MKVEFTNAKKKIATFWFVFSLILFLIVFIQTITGKFENNVQEAWGWLFALILPNLTVIISTFVSDINRPDVDTSKVDIFYLRLTLGLSLIYLLAVITILLLQPATSKTIIQLMRESSIFLGPMQGLVSGSLGLFFLKKEKL